MCVCVCVFVCVCVSEHSSRVPRLPFRPVIRRSHRRSHSFKAHLLSRLGSSSSSREFFPTASRGEAFTGRGLISSKMKPNRIGSVLDRTRASWQYSDVKDETTSDGREYEHSSLVAPIRNANNLSLSLSLFLSLSLSLESMNSTISYKYLSLFP